MQEQQTINSKDLIYYRLISLWVLNEALLGGIIHGLKIPVSGLIVGSCAVVCICLIAWYVPQKGAIVKATLIVAIFKMMLSPQAPPPAYIAVFFQGLMGELLFWKKRAYLIACVLLGILSLLESGLQRILVLTILYGNELWATINTFFSRVLNTKPNTNYSYFIIAGYVLLHVLAGVVIGLWAGLLPKNIKKLEKLQKQFPVVIANAYEISGIRKRKKRRIYLFVIWILLIVLYIQSYFSIGQPLLPSHIAIKIFLRSIIIVLAWVFVIGPFLTWLMKQWLQKKKQTLSTDIQKVTQLLPATQRLIGQSWRSSSGKKGIKRLYFCLLIILANTFYPENE